MCSCSIVWCLPRQRSSQGRSFLQWWLFRVWCPPWLWNFVGSFLHLLKPAKWKGCSEPTTWEVSLRFGVEGPVRVLPPSKGGKSEVNSLRNEPFVTFPIHLPLGELLSLLGGFVRFGCEQSSLASCLASFKRKIKRITSGRICTLAWFLYMNRWWYANTFETRRVTVFSCKTTQIWDIYSNSVCSKSPLHITPSCGGVLARLGVKWMGIRPAWIPLLLWGESFKLEEFPSHSGDGTWIRSNSFIHPFTTQRAKGIGGLKKHHWCALPLECTRLNCWPSSDRRPVTATSTYKIPRKWSGVFTKTWRTAAQDSVACKMFWGECHLHLILDVLSSTVISQNLPVSTFSNL